MLDSRLDRLAEHAFRAMLYEVSVTPKPGLVDRSNSGSHSDMDFFTFVDSSVIVGAFLRRMIAASSTQDIDLSSLLREVRYIGVEAEKAMLQATGGINTQKGLIFLLGCVCSVCGWMLAHGMQLEAEVVAARLRDMVRGICDAELQAEPCSLEATAGERIYSQSGLKGVRGEAEDGLPNVLSLALPVLRHSLSEGLSLEASALQSLMALMSRVDDTTVINRGGLDALNYMKAAAREYIEAGGVKLDSGYCRLMDLDSRFISRRISPGGCSDLLAIALFFHFIGLDEAL